MVSLIKDSKKGWWIVTYEEKDPGFISQRMAVTAKEVLDLLKEIKERVQTLKGEVANDKEN